MPKTATTLKDSEAAGSPRCRFRCLAPGCSKIYATTDGVRKHARKVHHDWLRAVDLGAEGRSDKSAPKPLLYCVPSADLADGLEGAAAAEEETMAAGMHTADTSTVMATAMDAAITAVPLAYEEPAADHEAPHPLLGLMPSVSHGAPGGAARAYAAHHAAAMRLVHGHVQGASGSWLGGAPALDVTAPGEWDVSEVLALLDPLPFGEPRADLAVASDPPRAGSACVESREEVETPPPPAAFVDVSLTCLTPQTSAGEGGTEGVAAPACVSPFELDAKRPRLMQTVVAAGLHAKATRVSPTTPPATPPTELAADGGGAAAGAFTFAFPGLAEFADERDGEGVAEAESFVEGLFLAA